MAVTLKIRGADRLAQKLQALPDRIQGGVKVVGGPIAYWAEWEFGSARLIQPGPKTLWSTNAEGRRVILTKQAPFGYIRIHRAEFLAILAEEYRRIEWGSLTPGKFLTAMKRMFKRAGQRCTKLISQSAPIDSGDLRASFEPVEDGDPLLAQAGGRELDVGQEWL